MLKKEQEIEEYYVSLLEDKVKSDNTNDGRDKNFEGYVRGIIEGFDYLKE